MIELDGRRIDTAWWGPAPDAAPTLVMLHEGLGSIGLWRDVPERLAAATGLGVFAYSRFGYGQSDATPMPRPLTYMHDEAMDVLPRVLDAAGIRRCVLVGHSDGASIAIIYAGGAQDFRVRGLALIAPHVMVEDETIASIAAMRDAYVATDLRDRMARHHRDPDNAFWGWNDAWLDPGFRAWDITGHVAHIRVPVLIVQGDDDMFGTVAQIAACREAAYCPVDVAMLPGARHAPHLETPKPALAAISDFVHRIFTVHEPHYNACSV